MYIMIDITTYQNTNQPGATVNYKFNLIIVTVDYNPKSQ